MSDRMRQIPFGKMMDQILDEYRREDSVFGVKKIYRAGGAMWEVFGEGLELPFGPAAGPHTQLAQNIVAGYCAGARFFELKTVQVLDGEELPVAKPCILAPDECYNVEWSTELYVPQALEEYIKAWYALKLLSRELELGDPGGFVFNMSVGYDLEGIQTPKIDSFIEGLKDAANTDIWRECRQWALDNLARFKKVDTAYLDGISPRVCRSITLSTLHGCPPAEIERIAAYLLAEKGLHTFIKCNPTLLGYEYARATLDDMGFGDIAFDGHHFQNDLQFGDAVPMLRRLRALAGGKGLAFGVKLTNTFPVKITRGELPGEEMYLSGRALFPLSIEVARRLTQAFDGELRISYSGGADIHNIGAIIEAGIWPVTLATTLLKPGGYRRLHQIAGLLAGGDRGPFTGVDAAKLANLAARAGGDPLYRKEPGRKPAGDEKKPVASPLPLLDCFAAPCQSGCPLGQDIPAYLRLAGEGKHLEALRVITERNPLPFITGTICSHRCMDGCMRNYYEGPVRIRDVKLQAALAAYDALIRETKAPVGAGRPVAVVGGGPAGLAAAYFLARAGRPVTVFEKRGSLGGIVRHVIPAFRIGDDAIGKDIALVKAMGAEIVPGREIVSLDELRGEGFGEIIVAVGAWEPGILKLEGGAAVGALEFLARCKSGADLAAPGKNVVIVGGGNTAMDAARAAKRLAGVERVTLVYRRTRREMPADAEELMLALSEGVELRELLAPVLLKGGVLRCEEMRPGAPDASGRRSPVPTGSFAEIAADTVVAAVGERVDTALYRRLGIPVDGGGKAVVDPDTLETGLEGVYAVGDALRGPASVAQAIGDALRCAKAITGEAFEGCAAHNANPDAGVSAEGKKGVLCHSGCAMTESQRCLECATLCGCCVDVCPNRANIAVKAQGRTQIAHLDALCNECGNCAVFCPWEGAPYRDKFTLFACEEDFAASGNPGVLALEGGGVRLRLDGAVADHVSAAALPVRVRALAEAVLGLPGAPRRG